MSEQSRFFTGAIIVSILGMLLLAYATQSGPGLSPDSRSYLSGARFLLEGRGICNVNGDGNIVPMTHFAPLYPILLAGTGFGGDPLERARWIGAAFFGGSIFLGGWLVFRAAGRSALGGIIASVLFALSFDLVRVYVMVWSEPAFIFFMLGGFLLIANYLQRLRTPLLALGSAAIACAFVTRYSGAALVISTGLVILLYPNRPMRRRLIDSMVYSVISIAPMIAWIVRNLITAQSAADREAAFHPPNWNDIQLSLATLANWFVPIPFEPRTFLAILAAAVVAIGAIFAARRFVGARTAPPSVEAPATQASLLLGAFCIVYVLFLLFSLTFVDAHTPLDYRILSPLYVGLLLWAILKLAPLGGSDRWRVVIIAALGFFLASQATRSAAWAHTTSDEGIGAGSKVWKNSPTLKFVADLPAGTLLYSNAPDLIDFRINRFAKPVPKVTNPITRKPEKTYRPYLMGLRDDLAAHGGYIVWFNTRRASRWYLVTETQINTDLPLEKVTGFTDGTVYRLRPAPATTKSIP
ncbi:MAG TPA: hypothetical protein VL282_13375 [Tepidisphaeraceae bacterium]|jgi:hypothetical protein|nr:hypothetical protein [Tepidisphaeraceae bacterium]